MMRDDFAVFILTHGRPNNIVTLKALKNGGYTGRLYFIIDDEDSEADEYKRLYGDKVIQFSKEEVAQRIDTMDTFPERRAIVYARNECWNIAERLGLKFFLQLDDDYTQFMFRFDNGVKLDWKPCKNLDAVFSIMCDFLEVSGAATVALAQGGDFIGGRAGGAAGKGLLRKAMNTFFCMTERRINFTGKMNEDVTAYVLQGGRGQLFFTVTAAMVNQIATQAGKGGMSEAYLDSGTYVKSFYSVMACPSSVKVSMMGSKHKRIHHKINWEASVPKILNEKWRKGGRTNGK